MKNFQKLYECQFIGFFWTVNKSCCLTRSILDFNKHFPVTQKVLKTIFAPKMWFYLRQKAKIILVIFRFSKNL